MPRPHSPLCRSGAAATRDIGDPFPIDAEVRDDDMQTVAGQFGDQFANAVFALKPGAWHGPIASSFGLHLVRVTEAKPARQREFSEVEPQVRERWRDEHQREANEQYYASLLKKYGVVVDESVEAAHWSARRVRRAGEQNRNAAAGSSAGESIKCHSPFAL